MLKPQPSAHLMSRHHLLLHALQYAALLLDARHAAQHRSAELLAPHQRLVGAPSQQRSLQQQKQAAAKS
jgi:hypothetical protein